MLPKVHSYVYFSEAIALVLEKYYFFFLLLMLKDAEAVHLYIFFSILPVNYKGMGKLTTNDNKHLYILYSYRND